MKGRCRAAWPGKVRFAPTIRHVIERIAMPSVASAGEETQASKAEFLARIDRPKRQNLVVLRANAQSLHKQWTNDVSEEDRNWDLCISWYDTAIVGDLGPHEYLAHQAADRKFTAIYVLFYPGSPLWNYEYIWLPDDDLLTSKRDINRLFEICYRYDLLLAQPSVTAQSFASHPVTRQDDRFWLRFSMFVEITCPIFSNQALRTCLESMKGSLSGFGLDYVWPRLLGDVVNRIAIIDEVAIFHTRPTGKNYNVEAAYEEGGKLMRSFGAATTNYAVGGVTRNGVIL